MAVLILYLPHKKHTHNSPETAGLAVFWKDSGIPVCRERDVARKDIVTSLDAALLSILFAGPLCAGVKVHRVSGDVTSKMADGSTNACKKVKYEDVRFFVLQKSLANIVWNSNNTAECTITNNATFLS